MLELKYQTDLFKKNKFQVKTTKNVFDGGLLILFC